MKTLISALTVISSLFMALSAQASSETERSQELAVNYTCEGNKVKLEIDGETINFNRPAKVTHSAIEKEMNLVVGDFDYLLWPRTNGTDKKALTLFKKVDSEGMRVLKEIDMGGRSPRTVTLPMTIKRFNGETTESITVTCDVTLSFVN